MSLTKWWRKLKNQDFVVVVGWFPAGMKWSFIDKNQENHVI
jgi:hypothetical protein